MAYDLRKLFKAVGTAGMVGTAAGDPERPDTSEPVTLIDDAALAVTCDPIQVAGFVDGIQAALTLTYRDQRPIYLYYVAAGALAPGTVPVAHSEHLAICAAEPDLEWIRERSAGIPVETLAGSTPPEMESSYRKLVSERRSGIERVVVDTLLTQTDTGAIVVDGAITSHPRDPRIVGVVKTSRTRYLSNESIIWHLPSGWRSPRFTVGTGGNERYSCYLQLGDKTNRGWSHGLIRLEAWTLDLLEPLGALALNERQSSRSPDPRRDRHLQSVRAVEEFLRGRRPAVFEWGTS